MTAVQTISINMGNTTVWTPRTSGHILLRLLAYNINRLHPLSLTR
jgi:hypothetical protein